MKVKEAEMIRMELNGENGTSYEKLQADIKNYVKEMLDFGYGEICISVIVDKATNKRRVKVRVSPEHLYVLPQSHPAPSMG